MKRLTAALSTLLLASCVYKGATNPDDPYEPLNRRIYQFNSAFDATLLKPPARLYYTVLPAQIRGAINNAYENVNLIPTVINDLLQGQWGYAGKDAWRFAVNSTIGIAGFFDPASHFGLEAHSNDLGLTFAKWGFKKSPYIVIPFLGPSTIRDGIGMGLNTFITPYPYLDNDAIIYGLLALRYVDLRSQLFDTEKLMNEALDPYSFMRDAYLQHRNYLITGVAVDAENSNEDTLYVDDDEQPGDYVDDEETPSDYVDEETETHSSADAAKNIGGASASTVLNTSANASSPTHEKPLDKS